jgi:hypothetical protein
MLVKVIEALKSNKEWRGLRHALARRREPREL